MAPLKNIKVLHFEEGYEEICTSNAKLQIIMAIFPMNRIFNTPKNVFEEFFLKQKIYLKYCIY
jgi:hypothetical protein